MIESDARKKRCPYKMAHNIPEGDRVGDIYCDGLDCMGWDQWTDPIYELDNEGRHSIPSNIIRHDPKEPPQGHCGMKPPELNCSPY